MVHGSGALQPGLVRGRVVGPEPAAALAARLPSGARGGEPRVVVGGELKRLLEQRAARFGRLAVGAGGVKALQGELGGNLGMVGDQRLVLDLDHHELVPQPLRVGEVQPPVMQLEFGPVARKTLLPEGDRILGPDPPDDLVDHPRPGASLGHARVLEEGEVGAGVALLVGVEEVVDGRVVLVDRLLDQPQSHYARIEVDVALGVLGDRRDVVDALELHRSIVCREEPTPGVEPGPSRLQVECSSD